ncbi:MAG: efflux transporter outer membrane subunit [Betaproteobacteria bacterium]|nr:efflux transporter outer membrane subunit [Betaproteobacteria bacterium]
MNRFAPGARRHPRARVAVVLALAATTLAGCAVGPDFVRPTPPPAERYTAHRLSIEGAAPADESAQHLLLGDRLAGDWWQLFRSNALDTVVRRALAGNRTLEAAAATLAQSQEVAAAQAGSLAPQVALASGVGRQKYGAQFLGTLSKPPPFTYFAVGPTVSYVLDYTGGAARSVEQQDALADYRQQQLAAAYLAVTGNAVLLSLEIASLREQIATIEGLLARDRENLALVRTAFDAGSVSRLDIISAKSQLAGDATSVAPLRQAQSVARHALAIVLGKPPANAALPELDLAQLSLPTSLPVSLPSELAHRRPDILAAEAQLHAATAAVGVADANLYPRIDLTASTGQQATALGHLFDHASNVWGLAGALLVPLFDGGTLRADRRAAIDAMRASAANYEQAVLRAFGQVADALEALDHDAEQLDAEARAQDAARASVDLTRMSYREGNVGVLQVLDAERLYQRARLGYVRATGQRYMDTARLFLALGGSAPPAVVTTGAALRQAPGR